MNMKKMKQLIIPVLLLLIASQQSWADIKDWYNMGYENIVKICIADDDKMKQLTQDIIHAQSQNNKEHTHLQGMLSGLHLNVSTASDRAHEAKRYAERDRLQELLIVISAKQMAVDPRDDEAFTISQDRELSDKIRAFASSAETFKKATELFAPLLTPAEYVKAH